MKKKLIPFGLFPANWGLEGKRRKEAWAAYYLEGEELDRELLDLKHDNKENTEYQLAKLDLDKKYNKIDEREYEKKHADIHKKPYFRVLYGEYKEKGPDQGIMTFELDWNEPFVRELEVSGWSGVTDDEIVNSWFEDACKQMFSEEDIESLGTPVTAFNRTRKRPINGNSSEYN